ncbi:MAG: ABC transporter substrate-binding protein [Tepidisphaeraceae bacterium]|jgi:branched-chain amino acid transport system substrate-binding protein
MRTLAIALLAAASLLTSSGCKDDSNRQSNANEIVVGEYASMSGTTATFGQSSHKGAVLAMEEINKEGLLGGKRIRLITEDNRSDSNEAVTAVQKLISRDHVVAVLGEVASKRSLAGGGVCQKAKIPMISPASTNPTVTAIGDYVFRICFTDDFQGMVNAQFALKELPDIGKKPWKKAAVFTDVANDYSKGLSKAFKETYPKNGGQIVAEETYRESDNDFKAQLSKIKSADPDAVFVPGYYTDVGKILRQARELQLNVPFFGGDGWDSPQTLQLGPIADNCFYTDHYSADDPRPEVQDFIRRFQARWGETPDAMAILGYDGMGVLANAIKRAGNAKPQAIRDALATTKDYPGASGTITMDANRNARKPIVVVRIHGGKASRADAIAPQ